MVEKTFAKPTTDQPKTDGIFCISSIAHSGNNMEIIQEKIWTIQFIAITYGKNTQFQENEKYHGRANISCVNYQLEIEKKRNIYKNISIGNGWMVCLCVHFELLSVLKQYTYDNKWKYSIKFMYWIWKYQRLENIHNKYLKYNNNNKQSVPCYAIC